MTGATPSPPIENSYLVPGTRLFAGEYPGSRPSSPASESAARLARFLDAGVTAFVDLTDPADGLAPYVPALQALGAERDIQVYHERLTIRDMDVCDAAHMRRVLDAIDGHLAAGRGVYVHCWGGIGRTGMVVGCWLVRRGRPGGDALGEVNALFRTMSPGKVARHDSCGSPQTEPQRQMVLGWSGHERAAAAPGGRHAGPAATREDHVGPSDRFHGALLGLAVGDALGTTLEFQRPGTFRPVTDMVGGGPFGLEPGQWTDDTSMALCLAESLLECNGFDAVDQMSRYVRWWKEGYWSSNGRCFDIGNTTRQALADFQRTGEPFSGLLSEHSAGNGSLMRLAPVPLFFSASDDTIRWAAESSRTTHGARTAVDACRYFAWLIMGAVRGCTKEELLDPGFAARFSDAEALHPEVAAVAAGSFLKKSPPAIRGRGYVVDCLEAALWAFATTDDFASGALAAVNLGDDADTTGAVYSQIAGSYYGASAIPEHWLARITRRADIQRLAERLYLAAR